MTTAEPQEAATHDSNNSHLFIGGALILVGLAFFADQVDWFEVRISAHLWPFFLLFFGALRVMLPGHRRGRRRSRRSGFWLLAIGTWGLICEFHIFGLEYGTAWPLLIVASGLNIVWRSIEGDGGPARVRGN